MLIQGRTALDTAADPRSGSRSAESRAAAQVAAPEGFRAEIVPLADIATVFAALERLAHRAGEANVFFEPTVLEAAMAEVRRTKGLFLVLVWDDAGGDETDGDERVLAGAMPIELARHRWGPWLSATQVWNHRMGVRGTPLILPGRGTAFWMHALDAIAAAGFPRILLMHTMKADGEAMRGLEAATQRSDRHFSVVNHTPYISLNTDLDGEAYLKASLSARRYRRSEKARESLGKTGVLERKLYTTESEVLPAFCQFLELEAAGWKGREGTAILRKPDALRFFLKVIATFARRGDVQVDTLELDGRPVAMSVAVTSGKTAFCWKTAYEESLSKYTPGYLTVMDVTRRIVDDPSIIGADSCTEAGHSMMESLWSEKSDAADILIDTRPASTGIAIAIAERLEKGRRRLRGTAKKVYHALRGRLAALR